PAPRLDLDQEPVDAGDVVLMPGESRTQDGSDTDRVLVDVWADVVRPDRVLARLKRHNSRLDVEVATELFPHHVHVAAEHEIRVCRRLSGGLAALAPFPLQGER